VGQRVGHRALHQSFNGRVDGIGRCELTRRNADKSPKKSLLLLGPRQWLSVVANRDCLLRHPKEPEKQVAHVSQDFRPAAACIIEVAEGGGAFPGRRAVR